MPVSRLSLNASQTGSVPWAPVIIAGVVSGTVAGAVVAYVLLRPSRAHGASPSNRQQQHQSLQLQLQHAGNAAGEFAGSTPEELPAGSAQTICTAVDAIVTVAATPRKLHDEKKHMSDADVFSLALRPGVHAPLMAAGHGSNALSELRSPLHAQGRRDPTDPAPRSGSLSWDDYFMALAFLSAERSKDPNKQVGAVIVNCDNVILGIGYNGFPRGCCDSQLPWAKVSAGCGGLPAPLGTKYPYVVHAEANALLNKNAASVAGARIYVTMFPCNECAKLLIQAGVREVVYHEDKVAHLTEAAGMMMAPHTSAAAAAAAGMSTPGKPSSAIPRTAPAVTPAAAATATPKAAAAAAAPQPVSSSGQQQRERHLRQQHMQQAQEKQQPTQYQQQQQQQRERRRTTGDWGVPGSSPTAAPPQPRSHPVGSLTPCSPVHSEADAGGGSRALAPDSGASNVGRGQEAAAQSRGAMAGRRPSPSQRGSTASPAVPAAAGGRVGGGAAGAEAVQDSDAAAKGAAWSGFWSQPPVTAAVGAAGTTTTTTSATSSHAATASTPTRGSSASRSRSRIPTPPPSSPANGHSAPSLSSGQILSSWAKSNPTTTLTTSVSVPVVPTYDSAAAAAATAAAAADTHSITTATAAASVTTAAAGSSTPGGGKSANPVPTAAAGGGSCNSASNAGVDAGAAAGIGSSSISSGMAGGMDADVCYLASLRLLRLAGVTLRQHRLRHVIAIPGPAAMAS